MSKKYSLTDTAIRGAKPNDKPLKLFDGNGLFLFVAQTAQKAGFAAIRRVAVSILKARKPPKVTNKRAMFKAAMCADLANFLFAGI